MAHSVPYLLLRMTAEEEPHSNGATVRDKLGKRLALDEKGDCGTLLVEALDDEEKHRARVAAWESRQWTGRHVH